MKSHRSWIWLLLAIAMTLLLSGNAAATDTLKVTVQIVNNALSFIPLPPLALDRSEVLLVRNRTGGLLSVQPRHDGVGFAPTLNIQDGTEGTFVQAATFEDAKYAQSWEFCPLPPLGDKTTTPCAIVKLGVSVPSLTGYGAIALLTLLAGTAVWFIRRRRTVSA